MPDAAIQEGYPLLFRRLSAQVFKLRGLFAVRRLIWDRLVSRPAGKNVFNPLP